LQQQTAISNSHCLVGLSNNTIQAIHNSSGGEQRLQHAQITNSMGSGKLLAGGDDEDAAPALPNASHC
jgi:hypothetical protein